MAKQVYFSILFLRIDHTYKTSMAVEWNSALANSLFNKANERIYKIQDLIFLETKVSIDVGTTGGSHVAMNVDLEPLSHMEDFGKLNIIAFQILAIRLDSMRWSMTRL
jgi:hypothetical protein